MSNTEYFNYIRTFNGSGRQDEDLLRYLYYNLENLFPADLIARLFGNRSDIYGRKINPKFKEYAIRIVNVRSLKQVFVRYYAVTDAHSIRRQLGNVYDLPLDVYIGAGYSFPPDKYKELRQSKVNVNKDILEKHPFRAFHHEFVLDLDLTDYDAIRTCCKGRNICQRCWSFMAVACELLDHILRHDFGVKHRLWLFSGGRGMHCWCFDRVMMTLTKEGRNLIVRHMQMSLLPLVKRLSPELMERELRHPTTVAGYKIALKHIQAILKDQDCLVTIEGQKLLLEYMDFYMQENEEDCNLRANIMSIVEEFGLTSSGVWGSDMEALAEANMRAANEPIKPTAANISDRIYDLLLQFNVTETNEHDNSVRAKITTFLAECGSISKGPSPSSDTDVDISAAAEPTVISLNVSERIYNLLLQYSTSSATAAKILQSVVMHVTYPRIDDPVSRDTSHLLRCPLSVHTSANKRLVVPFRPENVAQVKVCPNSAARLRDDIYFDFGSQTEDLLASFERDLGQEMVGWRAILEELVVALEADDVTVSLRRGDIKI